MNGIYLSAEELELLCDCSPEATRLYVLGLRPCMDIKTGTVGRESRVSLNGLSQSARFDPPRGSKRKPFCPTHRQTECLLDELNRNGLCERASTPIERKNLLLVLRLSKARTSEGTSFCQKNERAMNGQGTGKCSESKKTLENHGFMTDFDANKKQMSVTDERAISENQRYKNRDDIYLARENFDAAVNDNSDSDTPQNLAPFSRLLKTEGWRDAQILAQISTLKTLAAEGMTVADLRLGCAIARDNNASSVAYALKCAATSIRKRQHADTAQTAAAPRQHAKAATAGQRKAPQGGKFDPVAYINRNRSTINSQHHSQGGACYDHDQQTHLLA